MVHIMDERQTEWIRSANEMLDWLADNPEFIPDTQISLYRWYWESDFDGEMGTERIENLLSAMREGAAVLRANAPVGDMKKIESDTTYGLRRQFGTHTMSVAALSYSTCSMVPTDVTTEVVSYDIPADVYEKYKVVKQETVMKKVCPPITNREL
jgi:hypothetical protein